MRTNRSHLEGRSIASFPPLRPGGLALTERAMAFCHFPKDAGIADIGCGSMATVRHLCSSGLHAVGLDPLVPPSAVSPMVRGIAQQLPFKDSCIGGLFCECVLFLISDATAALREFSRVLRPNGLLVMSDLFLRCAAPHCSGVRSKEGMEGLLYSCWFSTELWEDHAKMLREFAADPDLEGRSPGTAHSNTPVGLAIFF